MTKKLSKHLQRHNKHAKQSVRSRGMMRSVPYCRDMTEKRFKHLQWREKRPPMLPFESYVLLEKLEGGPDIKAAPEITNITASAVPSAEIAHEAAPAEAAPSAPEAVAA